jgi:hypothetical protein
MCFMRCAQEVDILQDDSDGADTHASAAPAAPFEAAARTALLGQLPPDLRPSSEAALAATGGADTEALQSALEVGPHLHPGKGHMTSRVA